MATIETVDFGTFGKTVHTNISTIVGEGETNDRSDVLLIQTLIRLVGIDEFWCNAMLGIELKDLPDLNGVCDKNTIRAIWGFQRKRRHRLWNIDGRVHPASYTNRVLKKGPDAPQMMITLLNMNAGQIGRHGDIVAAIRKMSPSIIFSGNGSGNGNGGGGNGKVK